MNIANADGGPLFPGGSNLSNATVTVSDPATVVVVSGLTHLGIAILIHQTDSTWLIVKHSCNFLIALLTLIRPLD